MKLQNITKACSAPRPSSCLVWVLRGLETQSSNTKPVPQQNTWRKRCLVKWCNPIKIVINMAFTYLSYIFGAVAISRCCICASVSCKIFLGVTCNIGGGTKPPQTKGIFCIWVILAVMGFIFLCNIAAFFLFVYVCVLVGCPTAIFKSLSKG